jgi:hypothetical protein
VAEGPGRCRVQRDRLEVCLGLLDLRGSANALAFIPRNERADRQLRQSDRRDQRRLREDGWVGDTWQKKQSARIERRD